ncbi:unnamed protein product [Auanema sp. JU1783]|nr:unnamed protein product [Auanema sp. JU1783]
MNQDRRRLLDKNLLTFCRDLEVDEVGLFLISEGIFNDCILEKVTSCSTPTKSRQALIKAVKERGDVAFDTFYLALVNSRQKHLASLLRPLVSEAVFQSQENCENVLVHSSPHKLSFSAVKENFELTLNGLIKDLKVEEVDGTTAEEQLKLYENNKDSIYANFSSPKGLCLIINNEKFETMPARKGTHVDKINATNLFTQLGYKVIVKENLMGIEMMKAITDFAKDPMQLKSSSVVVIVLTHGEHDIILGSDDQPVHIHNFTSALNSVSAPHLTGKPKLFFIQACRGERYDRGIASTERDGTQSDAFRLLSCVLGTTEKPQNIRHLPTEADFLVAFATPPHFVSWRNSERGSWFIQGICQIFSRFAISHTIVDMLTMVNEKVSQNRTSRSEMQIPDFTCRLRKKFYFFPGVISGTAV